MIDIVNASVAASPLFGYKSQILKDRNFAPRLLGFTDGQRLRHRP